MAICVHHQALPVTIKLVSPLALRGSYTPISSSQTFNNLFCDYDRFPLFEIAAHIAHLICLSLPGPVIRSSRRLRRCPSSDTWSWPPRWGDKLSYFPGVLEVKYQAHERTIT